MYVPSPTTPFEGKVTKKINGAYTVSADGRSQTCAIAAGLRTRAPEDGIVIGDVVRCNASGQIHEVLPRRNQIARRGAVPMPGAYAHPQVLAANIDQVVAVIAAADPAPSWNLLDRYLVSAEAAGVPALVCLTKHDLVEGRPQGAEIEQVTEEYRLIGYPVIATSALDGRGLPQLEAALGRRLSLLVGKSGVGKTSLLNALNPGLGLRVQAVSRATGKGRHTTTHQEIFSLPGGGALIDTPGLREFGLWDVQSDDLAWYFPEMRPLLGQCRFRLDCQHDEEPGCAIRRAVNSGQISPYRYQSYLKLRAAP